MGSIFLSRWAGRFESVQTGKSHESLTIIIQIANNLNNKITKNFYIEEMGGTKFAIKTSAISKPKCSWADE